MKNKNGFTLIELLAVIIILGVLMIIAIPAVTKYISDSRKTAYIDTAKEIASGARNLVNSGKYEFYDMDIVYYLPSSCIQTENALKSPYGNFKKAYVGVTFNGDSFDYYWTSVDDSKIGVSKLVCVNKLTEDDIISNIKIDDIKTNYAIDGRAKSRIYNSDCKTYEEVNNETTAIKYLESIFEEKSDMLRVDDFGNIRFYGKDPSNYVKFEDSDDVWRLIGVVDGKIKAVRVIKYGNYSVEYRNNSYYVSSDIDNWENSQMKDDLNTTFYNSLSKMTQEAISEHTWHFETSRSTRLGLSQMYEAERAASKQWTGKVASIYVSDFYYAVPTLPTRINETYYMGSNVWLTASVQAHNWNFSRTGGAVEPCMLPLNGGWIGTGAPKQDYYYVMPTVYFNSSLIIKSGSGTSSNPYVLYSNGSEFC